MIIESIPASYQIGNLTRLKNPNKILFRDKIKYNCIKLISVLNSNFFVVQYVVLNGKQLSIMNLSKCARANFFKITSFGNYTFFSEYPSERVLSVLLKIIFRNEFITLDFVVITFKTKFSRKFSVHQFFPGRDSDFKFELSGNVRRFLSSNKEHS